MPIDHDNILSHGPYAFGRSQVTGGVGDTSGEPARAKVDENTNSLRVNLWVWDSVGLEWVKMTQPLEAAADVSDLEALLKGTYWGRTKLDWTSGNLDYKGGTTS